MSHLANLITSNRILGALRADDLDFMHPHLEPVPLRHEDALVLPDRQIEFVYFIEKGLASTIAESIPDAPVGSRNGWLRGLGWHPYRARKRPRSLPSHRP